LRLWFEFAARDAIRAAFGWATVVNVAALTYLSSKLGLSIAAGQGWTQTLSYAVVCFLIGVAIAFVVNLVFVAPLKVFRDLQPLTLKVSDAVESPTLLQSREIRGHEIFIRVRNRSERHILDCVLHILNAPQADHSIGPRFVEKFDLPPKATRLIAVAYWFSRPLPNGDDLHINLSGPTGAGFGGNRSSVPSHSTLKIQVRAPDAPTKYMYCDVSIDQRTRTLTAHERDSSLKF
jgi:hypothetical protein